VVTVTSLTGLIGQRFYSQPELDVGRVAPTTILAPDDARVEDKKSTEENRKAARTGAIPVLQIDQTINQQIYQDLQRQIDQGDDLREALGPFPIITLTYISANTQIYLRGAEETVWHEILAAVNPDTSSVPSPENSSRDSSSRDGSSRDSSSKSNSSKSNSSKSNSSKPSQTLQDSNTSLKQAQAIEELMAYRRRRSPQDLAALLQRFEQARQNYTIALNLLANKLSPKNIASNQLSEPKDRNADFPYDASFFDLPDAVWQDTQAGIYSALERLLTQGIAPGTPSEIIGRAVRSQIKIAVPAAGEPLAVNLLVDVLQPNLVPDPERTKQQAEQAADSVVPVYVEVREGEPIIRVGKEITQAQFVLLDHFGKSKRSINWTGLVGFSVIVLGGVSVFVLAAHRLHPKMRYRDRVLVWLLAISTPLLILFHLPTTSLPAVGMLIGGFYGSTLGTITIGLLTLGLPLGLEIDPNILFPGAAGGLVATLMAGRLRSREELALLGAGVGLTQGLVHFLISLISTAAGGQVWYILLPDAASSGLRAILWCIVASGLSPYLEHLFDLITPIRLAELSNPNRLMLQRLAAETPGTFQHTLFVSTLAEAAARALRCNVELVRAGTLYHDIGKMHDPQGFIENQMGGPNKHDAINDPWISADIIKKHVSEGLAMARKHRLPKALQAFIPEHQGTMLIAYFYHEAQQREKADPEHYKVQEADFRYPGPIPQSRETGIVMLADSCEAALRSLKEASHEQALGMVTKIIRARWQDNQLVESGLTREEMDTIAKVFVQIWQQFHHQRIPYPANAS
jgi:putative nucleotidyltransferase with HDIG domain